MGKKKDQKKSDKRADEGSGVKPASAASDAPPATPAAAKPMAKKSAEKPAKTRTASKADKAAGISTEDIALRAYFISEKRLKQGLHGNEHLDWLEAERQLMAEKKKPAKKSSAS